MYDVIHKEHKSNPFVLVLHINNSPAKILNNVAYIGLVMSNKQTHLIRKDNSLYRNMNYHRGVCKSFDRYIKTSRLALLMVLLHKFQLILAKVFWSLFIIRLQ